MTALTPSQTRVMRDAVSADAPSLEDQWLDLHERAERVAIMADLAPENTSGIAHNFTTRYASAAPAQRALAATAVGDIEILLETGLKALREVEARGKETHAPALALWREFYHARQSVLAALQPMAASRQFAFRA